MHKIRGISDHGSIDSHALMTLTPSCWTLWLMKTAWKPLNPNITSACHFFRFHSSIYQFYTFQVYFDSKAQNNGFSWKLNKKECAINFYENMSFEWFIEIFSIELMRNESIFLISTAAFFCQTKIWDSIEYFLLLCLQCWSTAVHDLPVLCEWAINSTKVVLSVITACFQSM